MYSNSLNLLVHQLVFVHIGEQEPQLSSRTSQEKKYTPNWLNNFSKDIQQHIVKVPTRSSDVFNGRENLMIRYHPSYIVVIHELTYTDFALKLFPFSKMNWAWNRIPGPNLENRGSIWYWSKRALVTKVSSPSIQSFF